MRTGDMKPGFDITPEPSEEEREAVERALASLLARAPESAWWREGIRESLAGEDSEERAADG